MDELDRIAGILPPTTWKSVLASIVYYSTFPVVRLATVTLHTVLALSAPLIHLVTYVTHVLLLPLSIFGKLEVSTCETAQYEAVPNQFIDILHIFWRCISSRAACRNYRILHL
jgi:hypothetical protein